jgi:hypothetical protein
LEIQEKVNKLKGLFHILLLKDELLSLQYVKEQHLDNFMHKSLAVSHHISPDNYLDKAVNTFADKVVSILYLVLRLTTKFAGLLGLVALSIPFVVVIPLVYFYLRNANASVKKGFQKIYDWINTANESDLRYAHLDLERRNERFRTLLAKKKLLDNNVLTMGVSSQTNLLISQFFNLEEALKNAAYPQYENELSHADLKELAELFEGAEIN